MYLVTIFSCLVYLILRRLQALRRLTPLLSEHLCIAPVNS
jgi:hypothetical protein